MSATQPRVSGGGQAALGRWREVLLKGMWSKKHFSPPERQEYFFDIQPPAPVATFVLQRLDRFVPLRSGPRGRGAMHIIPVDPHQIILKLRNAPTLTMLTLCRQFVSATS